jgi:ribosomal peptide maturation radical SAM protein 1
MLGGANCETAMGEATHRCFPWVDYVVSGEADGLIARLCRQALADGREIDPDELPPGVLGPRHRSGAVRGRRSAPRALFRDLDALPLPRFEDFFAALSDSSVAESIRPGLPLETSRGCWWGARHHCTFCGLNGSSMAFRSKSPDRVLAEVRELEARYGVSDFEVVDNILDIKYFKTVLPRLAEDPARRRMFYEVKANLSRRHVELLVQAGVRWVQPGIESLHTDVLRLMDKGVQGWQNVQLLKWARELGLRMSWAVLWGFPGERDEWYRAIARWIPALEHLQAPSGLIRLRYDRYSVYHERAGELGLRLRPLPAMPFVYPVAPEDLDDLTYFFVADSASDTFGKPGGYSKLLAQRPGVSDVLIAVRDWRTAFLSGLPPVLAMEERDGALEVIDSRSCARRWRTRLTGLARTVCLACDDAPMADQLARVLDREHGLSPAPGELADTVAELLEERLLLEIDGRLIALPIRGQVPELPGRTQFPGGHVDESAILAVDPVEAA